MNSSWRNVKKKIKLRYKDNGYPMPHAEMCKYLYTQLTQSDLEFTMENMLKYHSPDSFAHTEPKSNTEAAQEALYWAGQFFTPEQGINPMRSIYDLPVAKTVAYTTTANATTLNIMPAATATVSAQTDTQQQRGYLMDRLEKTSAYYGNKSESVKKAARELYNIDIDNTPKNLDDLIARLAAKDFTIDATKAALQAKYDGDYTDDDDMYVPSTRDYFYALTWNGPKADRVGYEAALDAFKTEITKAKDIIMIGDPAAGLTALQALEAWQPTGKAN